ncbi:MAG: hypothetical protein AAF585_22120 [Verrucomicrobiota bacterium]
MNLRLVFSLLALANGITSLLADEEKSTSESPPVEYAPVVAEVLAALKEEGTVVYIYVDVFRPDLDPKKAQIAEGLHEGYYLKPQAYKLLQDNLQKYPIIKPKAIGPEWPEFCDFTGVFDIEPKDSERSYSLRLHLGDFVKVVKRKKSAASSEEIESASGRWMDGELTVYRICEIMRYQLWPEMREHDVKEDAD